jgi:hypothetical protein
MVWVLSFVFYIFAHLAILGLLIKLIAVKNYGIWCRRDCVFVSCMCIVSIMDMVCFIKNLAIHPALWLLVLFGVFTFIESVFYPLRRWMDKEV